MAVNPQIVEALVASQLATMSPQVVRTSGAGKAYQSVAQSTAIAIQDATDMLRNVSVICSTVFGVSLAQMLATGSTEPYSDIIKEAQKVMTDAIGDFTSIGAAATTIVNTYPSS